jgi:hypothetical protein
MFKLVFSLTLTSWMILSSVMASSAFATDTDKLSDVLRKVDQLVCTQPEKIGSFYSSKLVIMIDDKRALLKNLIRSYRQMMSERKGIKCTTKRKVLAGQVGDKVGYVLVDELHSVTAENVHTDERHHGVCSYVFTREKDAWKISLEQCTSLPDYSIQPGDDALYYFHNPVY